MNKDIFISYKDDEAGSIFASQLCEDLENLNFSVFFNKNEKHSGSFPDWLREAVEGCKDFLLILTDSCLKQLKSHEKIDWVREELLIANKGKKHIIPILVSDVVMPKDRDEMPEDLRFLPDLDAIVLPKQYNVSPFEELTGIFKSKPEKDDIYRDIKNGNPDFNINEYFTMIQQRAKQHDPKAMYTLAIMYYYGISGDDGSTQRNFPEAYELLTAISETDGEYKAYADSLIGEMYYNGTVPREAQSFEKALIYHRSASDVSKFSAREYAYLRSKCVGDSFEPDEIEEYYNKAIQDGDKIAILGFAQHLKLYGRFKDAAELYRKTSKDIPEAELELGKLYAKGVLSDPPEPDYYRAAFYFQHAIDTGNCDARTYFELGRLYLIPYGDFPKDNKLAQNLFLEAAERGNINAAYKLGCMYEFGIVERDIYKAVKYFTTASEAGMPLAAYHLSLLYQQPDVCNYHKAFKYAKTSAERGVPEGEFVFGCMLLIGRGCQSDRHEAVRYLNMAAEHGIFQAKVLLEESLCDV